MLALVSCAGTSLRTAPAPPLASTSEISQETVDTRHLLFKIHYQGPRDSGSVRLILRIQSDELFQISTADSLGRTLWSLQSSHLATLFVDHRRQTYCSSDDEMRFGEATLEMFPLTAIPRLLQGQLPTDLSAASEGGSGDYRDDLGRRWSVRFEGGEPMAWTVWLGERPVLWWTRQGKGGILSHRDGSQFRWREVVSETKAGSPLAPLVPPADFHQDSCDVYDDLSLFRQDQSSPAGDGSS